MIRDATIADAKQIAEIHVRSWQSAYADLLPQEFLAGLDAKESQQSWRKWIADASNTVLVWQNQDVFGFISFGAAREYQGSKRVGEIYAIYLLPECWGQGIGAQLLGQALESLSEAGYKGAIVWVLVGNQRAIRCYQKLGFAVDGEKKTDKRPNGLVLEEIRLSRKLQPLCNEE